MGYSRKPSTLKVSHLGAFLDGDVPRNRMTNEALWGAGWAGVVEVWGGVRRVGKDGKRWGGMVAFMFFNAADPANPHKRTDPEPLRSLSLCSWAWAGVLGEGPRWQGILYRP